MKYLYGKYFAMTQNIKTQPSLCLVGVRKRAF